MFGVAGACQQDNVRALATRFTPARSAGAADGAIGLLRSASDRLARGQAGDTTQAAVAQISALAQQFLKRFEASGAASGSFDLHLDLAQLGLRIDGRGGRSIEAHGLSIDLHVEAHRGVLETERGPVNFEQLDLSFSVEGLHARLEQRPSGDDAAGPASPQAGRPAGALIDGLKRLASLLDRATAGADKSDFGLDDLRELLAEHEQELRRLLEQLGQAFEGLRGRAEGAPTDGAGAAASGETTDVRLEALRFVRATAQAQDASGGGEPAQ